MHGRDDHITLGQAAKITPGRPSTNCLWRWCRRGVLARNGRRVRLQHVRVGGKIFTTPRWVEAFGNALAEADNSYFVVEEPHEEPHEEPSADQPRPIRRQRSTSRHAQQRRESHDQAMRELEEAGL